MNDNRDAPNSDTNNLTRFVTAQEKTYEQALDEIKAGRKASHWMWFIFPQMRGLGLSAMSKRYAISGLEEATAYLGHPLLGSRLVTCAEAMLLHHSYSATEILGSPDDMKLQSSATLFAAVAQPETVFTDLLQRYFDGQRDAKTLQLLASV